jgi:uncharacterized protein YbjQ (UPF0145 family)
MKMNLRNSRLTTLLAIAACVLSGCASVPESGVARSPAEVKIYETGKLSVSQYQVVRRIWVDSWRSAFRLPTYANEADSIAALQAEAGRLGADGLINVNCIDQGPSPWSSSTAPAILCYGNAIRLRKNEG